MSEVPNERPLGERLFLIDAMAYIFRAFYAIRAPMTAKDGTPTNALFGFVRSFEKIMADFAPQRIAAVFDAGEKTFRNDLYEAYKANRAECPEDLRPQFELVKRYLRLRGIPILIQKGYEADDLIATAVNVAARRGWGSVICTGDKDLMQLVDDRHTLLCQTHKDNLMVDEAKVKELMGVPPALIVDFLAITGDASDNVPGIKGMGEKTAAQLLALYPNLEALLASPRTHCTAKQAEKVEACVELARLSRTLVSLRHDLDLGLDPDLLCPAAPDFEGLAAYYDELNARALRQDLQQLQGQLLSHAGASAPRSAAAGITLASFRQLKTPLTVELELFAARPQQHEILRLQAREEGGASLDLIKAVPQVKEDGLEALRQLRDAFKGRELTLICNGDHFFSRDIHPRRHIPLTWEWLVLSWLGDSQAGLTQIQEHHMPLMQESLYNAMKFDELIATETLDISRVKTRYHTLCTLAEVSAAAAAVRKAGEAAFDTETSSLDPLTGTVVGLGLSTNDHEGYYIPLFALGEAREAVLAELRALFADPKVAFIAQNAKFDLRFLRSLGIEVANVSFDTLLASYVSNPSRFSHDLDSLSLSYLNYRKIPTEALLGSGRKARSMAEVPMAEVARYCCEDVDCTLRLKRELAAELDHKGLTELYRELDLPLVKVLVDMEHHGILADRAQLQALSAEFGAQLAQIEESIYSLAGHHFNIGSPQQVATVLFEELKLPAGKKTKAGYSTDAEVLEELADQSQIVREILRHRGLSKLKSTYADALQEAISPATGRIHTNFSQALTATGRLSSSAPNLQNIPARSREGLRIRSAFVAPPGHILFAADYSQIELRIMAHLSGDPAMIATFQAGGDIHAQTAAKVFNVDLAAVTKEQRSAAKAVNFGIIYGQGPWGLAKEIGVSPDEAKDFIKAYFRTYPRVQSFMNELPELARQTGYAQTAFGRRRYLPELFSANGRIRSAGERIAINSPLQGTAADIIKKAMIQVPARLKSLGLKSRMLLQIHDELLFEAPADELSALQECIPALMSGVAELKVPLTVDCAWGHSWADC